jgi:hypothetical protein
MSERGSCDNNIDKFRKKKKRKQGLPISIQRLTRSYTGEEKEHNRNKYIY